MVLGKQAASHAQNLIPNPGFEDYKACPSAVFSFESITHWITNRHKVNNGNIWNQWEYIHTCYPPVRPWWDSELGEGVIGRMAFKANTENKLQTVLLWTELISIPEKDSLYYIEYTTAPTHVYSAQTQSLVPYFCIPPYLGVKLEGADFDGIIGEVDSIKPDMYADEGGIAHKIPNTTQIGHCFKATGLERYLLYGLFQKDTLRNNASCIGGASVSSFGGPWFISDNIKLEKMKLEISSDTVICERRQIDFSKYTDYYALSGKQFIWNDGVEGVIRSFTTSGSYQLTMLSKCGSITSNWINVQVEQCNAKVFVPSAFTPNGDGINDVFNPVFSNDYEISDLRLSIYNRWGKPVFQTNSLNTFGWDGKVQGLYANQGSYFWHVEFGYLEGDKIIRQVKSGSVVLLR